MSSLYGQTLQTDNNWLELLNIIKLNKNNKHLKDSKFLCDLEYNFNYFRLCILKINKILKIL